MANHDHDYYHDDCSLCQMEKEALGFGGDIDLSLLTCNAGVRIGDFLPVPNVVMCIDGIEVTFKVEDGKFDVDYDADKITESAGVFFECLKDYFIETHCTETH